MIAIPTLLYGCATTQYKTQESGAIAGVAAIRAPASIPKKTMVVEGTLASVKTVSILVPKSIPKNISSDRSHLQKLTMSREFITDSYTSERSKNNKGNKKINSIKPTGKTQPRAVILLENTMIPSSLWDVEDYNFTVRRKNIEICKGFMKMQTVENVRQDVIKTGDMLKANSKNHVITYMPVLGRNKNNIPSDPEDCKTLIEYGYDYTSSKEELLFIFKDKKLGKSPYLAVYESLSSPYTSMILSIGDLSYESIGVLGSKWPELIMKVYQHGDKIDPRIGVAVMLANDNSLKAAQKDVMWRNIKIGVSGTTCGVVLASSTVTLSALLGTPACKDFVFRAMDTLGYS